MKRYFIFVQKEFFHILRDKRTMLILLLLPIIQIVLFGFALSTEIKNSNIAIVDFANDNLSAELTQKFSASEYFTVVKAKSAQEAASLMQKGKVDLTVILDRELKKAVLTKKPEAAIQIITDATDPNKAKITAGYASAIISSADLFEHARAVQEYYTPSKINITTQMLYNPGMKGAYNFVPGVMGLVLMLICAMMTSLSIVKEKERGTMDLISVSPVKPLAVITAKVIPYLSLSIVNLVTILLLSKFALDVPIRGSILLLMFLSVIFITVSLSLGLLISTIVESQMAALIGSGLVLMMPTVILSGMMFPIESMPIPLQIISIFIPARWYIEGVREVMIQGVGIEFVTKELVILTIMAIILLTVSIKKYKVRL